MASSAWCKFVNHISYHGGLFLGPKGEDSNYVLMFKNIISEEEAVLGTYVPKIPTAYTELARKAGIPEEKAKTMLKHMAQKGVVFERIVNGVGFYNITPFIPGFYEYVMTDPETRNDPYMAKLFTNIGDMGALMRQVDGQDGGLMKVTPVMKEVGAQRRIYSFEDVMTFVNHAKSFSVADCACRLSMRLLGEGCDHPVEDTCIQFDDTAEYYIRTGRGHRITREECVEILLKCERAGLVHTAFTVEGEGESSFICNCCGCSCSGLRFLNAFDGNPFSRSNFRAVVNYDNCVACGECVDICPVNAVTLGTRFCEDTASQLPEYKQAAVNKMGPEDAHMNFRNERRSVGNAGTAPCKAICPAHISVQGYIRKAYEGKYREALEVIKKDNPLPAVCGRICPHPCESGCTRGDLDEPLAIDDIKMFIADQELDAANRFVPDKKADYSERIAVVGSGPAGLSCAYYLAEYGYKVTVFEREQQPGGMLTLGIPEFRLSKDVVNAEIDILRDMGVEFKCGVTVGRDVTLDGLREQGYRAIYLAVGASLGTRVGCDGDDLPGVYTGVDFLREVNRGGKPEIGGKVAVIGGGNVAIDVARSALRLGSDEVTIIYRRTRDEMPASADEVLEAEEEGVRFRFLSAPVEITGDGRAQSLKLELMELGEPDEKGRRKPVPTGEFETIPVTSVISAIGQQIDMCNIEADSKIALGKKNTVVVDALSYQTGEKDVFAGGDCVTGPKFAIDAIAMGKQGAISIHRLCRQMNLTSGRNAAVYTGIDTGSVDFAGFDTVPRQKTGKVNSAEAAVTFRDLRRGLTEEQVHKETERCLSCGKSVVDANKCIGCGVCTVRCKFDAIHLARVSDSQPAGNFGTWYKRLVGYSLKRAGRVAINSIKSGKKG